MKSEWRLSAWLTPKAWAKLFTIRPPCHICLTFRMSYLLGRCRTSAGETLGSDCEVILQVKKKKRKSKVGRRLKSSGRQQMQRFQKGTEVPEWNVLTFVVRIHQMLLHQIIWQAKRMNQSTLRSKLEAASAYLCVILWTAGDGWAIFLVDG